MAASAAATAPPPAGRQVPYPSCCLLPAACCLLPAACCAEEGKAAVAAAGGEVPAGVPDFWMIALRNAMEEETVS